MSPGKPYRLLASASRSLSLKSIGGASVSTLCFIATAAGRPMVLAEISVARAALPILVPSSPAAAVPSARHFASTAVPWPRSIVATASQ